MGDLRRERPELLQGQSGEKHLHLTTSRLDPFFQQDSFTGWENQRALARVTGASFVLRPFKLQLFV